ncbi:hypothetical protein AB0B88_28905 [Micromonospora haikouensis]|uniref:hypothetical protein n=1 Tax=Micromonospora haikouensis TaxID=686309 RepID=UPI0033FB1CBD
MPDLHISTDPEWQWVYDAILYGVGEEYPEADPTALRQMGDELLAFTNTLNEEVAGTAGLAGNMPALLSGDAAQAFEHFAQSLTTNVPVAGDISTALGQSAYDFALDAEQTQYNIAIAMFTTLWDVFLALSGGASAFMVPALIRTGSEIVSTLIAQLRSRILQRIANLTFDAIGEGFEELWQGLAAQGLQMAEGNRDKIDGNDVLLDFLAGMLIGATASGVMQAGAKWFPKVGTHRYGQEIFAAAGELLGETFLWGILGGDFNPGATVTSSVITGFTQQWAEDLGQHVRPGPQSGPGGHGQGGNGIGDPAGLDGPKTDRSGPGQDPWRPGDDSPAGKSGADGPGGDPPPYEQPPSHDDVTGGPLPVTDGGLPGGPEREPGAQRPGPPTNVDDEPEPRSSTGGSTDPTDRREPPPVTRDPAAEAGPRTRDETPPTRDGAPGDPAPLDPSPVTGPPATHESVTRPPTGPGDLPAGGDAPPLDPPTDGDTPPVDPPTDGETPPLDRDGPSRGPEHAPQRPGEQPSTLDPGRADPGETPSPVGDTPGPADPEHRVGDPEHRPAGPENRLDGPEHRSPDPESHLGGPESHLGDPATRPGDPEARPHGPGGHLPPPVDTGLRGGPFPQDAEGVTAGPTGNPRGLDGPAPLGGPPVPTGPADERPDGTGLPGVVTQLTPTGPTPPGGPAAVPEAATTATAPATTAPATGTTAPATGTMRPTTGAEGPTTAPTGPARDGTTAPPRGATTSPPRRRGHPPRDADPRTAAGPPPQVADSIVRPVEPPVGTAPPGPVAPPAEATRLTKPAQSTEAAQSSETARSTEPVRATAEPPPPTGPAGGEVRPAPTDGPPQAPADGPQPVPAGWALVDPYDTTDAEAARSFPARDGELVVFAHGTPDHLVLGDRRVTPEQLAELLGADRPQRIVLMSCDTGADADGFAAKLSRLLPGTSVTAPTGTVWTTPGGHAFVAGTAYGPDGRPRPAEPDAGHGWRTFTSDAPGDTHVQEAGADLPGTPPRPVADAVGDAVAWKGNGRPYTNRPVLETTEHLIFATHLEEQLGAYLYRLPRVRRAAQATVARLREVLDTFDGRPGGVWRSFIKDDPTSAGQVGDQLTAVQVDELLDDGNLRELMTAFYNAAYFHHASPDPTLKTVVQELFADTDWDRAAQLGLDVPALQRQHEQLDTLSGALIGGLAKLVGRGHTFGEGDPFALGRVAGQSEKPLTDLIALGGSQANRIARHDDQANRGGPGKFTPTHLASLGAPLSDREKRYLAGRGRRPFTVVGTDGTETVHAEPDTSWTAEGSLGVEMPLPWVGGRAGVVLDTGSRLASVWYRRTHHEAGLPVTAGISGTTARLMMAFEWLNVPGVSREDFLLAVIAWMLTFQDHSLYEILRGAEIVGSGPPVSTMAADEVYEALAALGVPAPVLRQVGDPEHRLPAAGPEGMPPAVDLDDTALLEQLLPHEAAYFAKARAAHTAHGYAAVTSDELDGSLEVADELANAAYDVATAKQLTQEWLNFNSVDPKALANRLTRAHLLALQVWTGSNHSLLNAVAPAGPFTDLASELVLEHKIREAVDLLVDLVPAEIPSILANDPILRGLHDEMATDPDRTPERIAAVREQAQDRGREIRDAVEAELRAHFDMVVDALRQLPPADKGVVWRADWAAGGLTNPLGKMFSAYGGDDLTLSGLNSASRDERVAQGVLAKYTNSATSHRVLIGIELAGHAGRDITPFSAKPTEQEVLFLPGARFVVTSREIDEAAGIEKIMVREVEPEGVARETLVAEAKRSIAEVSGLGTAVRSLAEAVPPLAEQVRALTPELTAALATFRDLLDRSTAPSGADEAVRERRSRVLAAQRTTAAYENTIANAWAAVRDLEDRAQDPGNARAIVTEAERIWADLHQAGEDAHDILEAMEHEALATSRALGQAQHVLFTAFHATESGPRTIDEAGRAVDTIEDGVTQLAAAEQESARLTHGLPADDDDGLLDRSAALARNRDAATRAMLEAEAAHAHLPTQIRGLADDLRLVETAVANAEWEIGSADSALDAVRSLAERIDARYGQSQELARLIDELLDDLDVLVFDAANTFGPAASPLEGELTIGWVTDPVVDEQVPAGRVLVTAADGANIDAARAFPADPDRYVIFAHGTPHELDLGGGRGRSPADVARLIRDDPGWQGRPILLMSCHTAADADTGFAAALARLLDVPVTAPTGTAWSTPDGSALVAGTVLDAEGRPRPAQPGPDDGWRTFTPTADDLLAVDDLGPRLAGSAPPHTTASAPPPHPVAWGPDSRPYGARPILDTAEYREHATRFERDLGAHLYQLPHVQHAAKATVERLREVLEAYANDGRPDGVRRSFVKDDPTSAGQVGDHLTDAEVRALLRDGNLRELMTAFYNAAYYNDAGPEATLKKVVQSIVADQDWTRADALGLDSAALRKLRRQLTGWNRTVMQGIAGIVGKGYNYAFDPFALGNITALSKKPAADTTAITASQAGRSNRLGTADFAKNLGVPGKLTPRQLAALGAALSDRERRYLTGPGRRAFTVTTADGTEQRHAQPESSWTDEGALGVELPLPWVGGRAWFDNDTTSLWYRHTHTKTGLPVVAGISGTTARLLAAFAWLKVPGVAPEHFLLAIAAWMLTSEDHSLYEILRGAEIVDVGPIVSEATSAEDVYHALATLGLPVTTLRGLADTGMLPHEAAYQAKAEAHGFKSLTPGDLARAGRRRYELWQAAGQPQRASTAMLDWIATNGMDTRALTRQLTPAHFTALQAYTGSNHSLLNAVAPAPVVGTVASGLLLERAVRRSVDRLVEMVLGAAPQEIPSAVSTDPAVVELLGQFQADPKKHDKADSYRQKLRDRASALAAELEAEMRAHFDMAIEAIQLLPPATGMTVWRSDWAAGKLGDPVAGKLGQYGGTEITFGSLSSASRRSRVAEEFLAGHTADGTSHPVLLEMQLDGHAGRDITPLSAEPDEQEVLFLPGARFEVVSRTTNDQYEHIVVREVTPAAIALHTFDTTAEHALFELTGIGRSIERTVDTVTDLTAAATRTAAQVDKAAADVGPPHRRVADLARQARTTLGEAKALDEQAGRDRQAALTVGERALAEIAPLVTDRPTPAAQRARQRRDALTQALRDAIAARSAAQQALQGALHATRQLDLLDRATRHAADVASRAAAYTDGVARHARQAETTAQASATTIATAIAAASVLAKQATDGTATDPRTTARQLARHRDSAGHAAADAESARSATEAGMAHAPRALADATRALAGATANAGTAEQYRGRLDAERRHVEHHANEVARLNALVVQAAADAVDAAEIAGIEDMAALDAALTDLSAEVTAASTEAGRLTGESRSHRRTTDLDRAATAGIAAAEAAHGQARTAYDDARAAVELAAAEVAELAAKVPAARLQPARDAQSAAQDAVSRTEKALATAAGSLDGARETAERLHAYAASVHPAVAQLDQAARDVTEATAEVARAQAAARDGAARIAAAEPHSAAARLAAREAWAAYAAAKSAYGRARAALTAAADGLARADAAAGSPEQWSAALDTALPEVTRQQRSATLLAGETTELATTVTTAAQQAAREPVPWARGDAPGDVVDLSVPAGRVLVPGSDRANLDAARAFAPDPDRYVVFAHGTPEHLVVGDRRITPAQLARMIQDDPAWGGRPIVLMACDTAASPAGAAAPSASFAETLAGLLPGTPVTAPNGTAWLAGDGQAFVAGTDYDADGRPRPAPSTEADQWRTVTVDPDTGQVDSRPDGARLGGAAHPAVAGPVSWAPSPPPPSWEQQAWQAFQDLQEARGSERQAEREQQLQALAGTPEQQQKLLLMVSDHVIETTKRHLYRGSANQVDHVARTGGLTHEYLGKVRSGDYFTPDQDPAVRLAQQGVVATHLHTGNCGENAALAFSLLWQLLPGVRLTQINHSLDHAFVVIGDPDSADAVICDPWPVQATATTRRDYFMSNYDGQDRFTAVSDGTDLLARAASTVDLEALGAVMDMERPSVGLDELTSQFGDTLPRGLYRHLHTTANPPPPEAAATAPGDGDGDTGGGGRADAESESDGGADAMDTEDLDDDASDDDATTDDAMDDAMGDAMDDAMDEAPDPADPAGSDGSDDDEGGDAGDDMELDDADGDGMDVDAPAAVRFAQPPTAAGPGPIVSTPVPAGFVWLPAADTANLDLAASHPHTSGRYLVFAHGTPTHLAAADATLTAAELAALVRADPAWRPGQAVTLVSCDTAARPDGFATQLAHHLGVPVTAPTHAAWTTPDHHTFTAPTVYTADGRPRPGAAGTAVWHHITPGAGATISVGPHLDQPATAPGPVAVPWGPDTAPVAPRPVPAGLLLADPDDTAALDAARRFPARDGTFVVFADGDSGGIVVGDTPLSPTQLADAIRADPRWTGRPVLLVAGRTAAGSGFAEQLARLLPGTPVTAPEGTAWTTSDGRAFVAPTRLDDGRGRPAEPTTADRWRTFTVDPATGLTSEEYLAAALLPARPDAVPAGGEDAVSWDVSAAGPGASDPTGDTDLGIGDTENIVLTDSSGKVVAVVFPVQPRDREHMPESVLGIDQDGDLGSYTQATSLQPDSEEQELPMPFGGRRAFGGRQPVYVYTQGNPTRFAVTLRGGGTRLLTGGDFAALVRQTGALRRARSGALSPILFLTPSSARYPGPGGAAHDFFRQVQEWGHLGEAYGPTQRLVPSIFEKNKITVSDMGMFVQLPQSPGDLTPAPPTAPAVPLAVTVPTAADQPTRRGQPLTIDDVEHVVVRKADRVVGIVFPIKGSTRIWYEFQDVAEDDPLDHYAQTSDGDPDSFQQELPTPFGGRAGLGQRQLFYISAHAEPASFLVRLAASGAHRKLRGNELAFLVWQSGALLQAPSGRQAPLLFVSCSGARYPGPGGAVYEFVRSVQAWGHDGEAYGGTQTTWVSLTDKHKITVSDMGTLVTFPGSGRPAGGPPP